MSVENESKLRLFIAFDLPENVKESLATAMDSLRAVLRGPFGWVSPDGMHLTLKFLGNASSGRVDEIADAVRQACAGREAFALRLSGAGTFPAGRSPSVIWAGLDGDVDELASLQREIEDAMEPLGFPKEKRPFIPHLTLGRVRDRLPAAEIGRLAELLASVRYGDQGPFAVERIALKRSELGPGGARYSTLSEAGLTGVAG